MMNETQHSQSAIDYLRSILSSNIYDLAQVTPLQKMEKLSERLGNSIFIKREDRQPVHSFKLRGAFAMISKFIQSTKRGWSHCGFSRQPRTRGGTFCQTFRFKSLDCNAAKHTGN